MTPAREEALFALALEKPVEKRAAFLDAVCEGDAALRARLEALLAAHDQPDTLLMAPLEGSHLRDEASARQPQPLTQPEPKGAPDEAVGQTLGRYRLLEKIGEGGCGVVYVAEQTEPVRRRVALKVIKLGMDTKQVVARFEAERQALAMMDHPNIAKVLDAGTTGAPLTQSAELQIANRKSQIAEGRPFFVMELVRGIKITDYCDQNDLSTHERLDLFVKVCHAIQHAHQKGIIHRDIKPSNILVTLHDGAPVPKVIDFGIAKATEGRLTDATVYTQLNQFIGTPAYMSPEQAEMSGLDIDTRSDIYSLGVLLYELLTGKTPFDANELLAQGFDAMRKTILEKEPLRPSTKLAALWGEELTTTAKRRSSEGPRLICLLKGDLDWIVMKCLEKDRTRRYDSASAIAADLLRHSRNEPVLARPPSRLYRFHRLVRRNRLTFAAAAVVFAALVIGLGIATWQFHEQKKAHLLAEDRLARMHIQAGEKLAQQHDPLRALPYFIEAMRLERGNAAREDIHRRRLGATLQLAPRLTLLGFHTDGVLAGEFNSDGSRLVTGSVDRTARVWDVRNGEPAIPPLKHGGSVEAVCFSPDGARFATMSIDGVARLWSATNGQALSAPLVAEDFKTVTDKLKPALHFSPDGRTLLTAHGSRGARLWEVTSGVLLRVLEHPDVVNDAVFSPDGACVLTGCEDRFARFWDAQSGDLLGPPLGQRSAVSWVGFSPDSRRFFAVTGRRYLQLWDAATRQPVTESFRPADVIFHLDFSPDGQRLMTADWHGPAWLWDARDGQRLLAMPHEGGVMQLSFSPDGARVATACWDGTARIWDTSTGQLVDTVLPQQVAITHVRFSPDGQRLAVCGAGGLVEVWDFTGRETVSGVFPHPMVAQAVFSADERHILTAGYKTNDSVRLWNAVTGQPAGVPLPHAARVNRAVFSPDGTRVLTACDDGVARLWNWKTGEEVEPVLRHAGSVQDAQFSGDGRRIVTACADGTARVWDAATGQPLGALLRHGRRVERAEFSPDGREVATASADGTARIWDATTGAATSPPLKHPAGVHVARFSHDGRRLVTACYSAGWAGDSSAFAQVWEVPSGRAVGARLVHQASVHDARFSPDDRRVVTASGDQTVCVWDAATGQRLTPPLRQNDIVTQALFSPDGRRVITGSEDGTVRVWDAATGEPVTMPMAHPSSHDLMHLSLSRDGEQLLIATGGDAATLCRLAKTDLPFAELDVIARALSGHRLAAQGGLVPLDRASLSNAWSSTEKLVRR